MKFPGTYAAYAAVMSLFGQTDFAIHLGLLFVNAATVALVFFLARRLINETAGLVAAASYALLSISPTVLGFAAHATHFVVLPCTSWNAPSAGSTCPRAVRPVVREWRAFWPGGGDEATRGYFFPSSP
jgi:hypothetical protein